MIIKYLPNFNTMNEKKKQISDFIKNVAESDLASSGIIMNTHIDPLDTSYNSSCTNEESKKCGNSYNKDNCQNSSGCCDNAKNFGECSDAIVKPNKNQFEGCSN